MATGGFSTGPVGLGIDLTVGIVSLISSLSEVLSLFSTAVSVGFVSVVPFPVLCLSSVLIFSVDRSNWLGRVVC